MECPKCGALVTEEDKLCEVCAEYEAAEEADRLAHASETTGEPPVHDNDPTLSDQSVSGSDLPISDEPASAEIADGESPTDEVIIEQGDLDPPVEPAVAPEPPKPPKRAAPKVVKAKKGANPVAILVSFLIAAVLSYSAVRWALSDRNSAPGKSVPAEVPGAPPSADEGTTALNTTGADVSTEPAEVATSTGGTEAAKPGEPASGTTSDAPAGADPQAAGADGEIPTAPTMTSGVINIAGKQTVLADSITVYYPLADRVEIGFYNIKLTAEDKQKIAGVPALLDPKAPAAFAVIGFSMVSGTTICNRARITRLTVDIPRRSGGKVEPLQFDLGKNVGGISDLSCHLDRKGQLSASLSQTASKAVPINSNGGLAGMERVDATWELRTNGPIISSRVPGRYQFTSEGKRPVAVWDHENGTVEIGYFTMPLAESDYLTIRRQRSLTALAENKPLVTVGFELNEGATAFTRENIRSYSVNFYRNPAQQLVFPGEKDKLSFLYVRSSEESAVLERVAGQLQEGEQVHGQMKDSAPKKFDSLPYYFSWDMKFSPMLMDVHSEPVVTFAQEGALRSDEAVAPKRTGGEIQVGKARAELVDAVALFYPGENELAVAFYPEKLTPDEHAAVANQKTVWSAVNGKSPNLVVSFNLKPGSTALSKDNVLHYRLVFVREKLGQFYFQGPSDRATVKKLAEEVNPNEVPYLGGSVKTGKSIAFTLNGTYVAKSSGLAFSWKVDADTTVSVAN